MTTAAPDVGLYLKPGVKCEPLIARWHAFHFLIAPLQYAMYLSSRHIPLLESFLASPSVHVAAAGDPSLYGGAFVDLPASAAPDVQALLAETRTRAQPSLSLFRDLKALDDKVRSTGDGRSLRALYESTPSSLRGAVEFSYDVNNRPLLRLREDFLYEDALAQDHLQEVMLHNTGDTDRKFFLNTPRIDAAPDALCLPIPFAAAGLERLAAARIRATCAIELARALNLPAEDAGRLEPFLTREPPERKAPDYDGDRVRVRYFGHACVLVQTADVAILIDPTFATERDGDMATLTFSDLPNHIDYVVISHGHHDHFSAEALLALRGRIGQIVVPRNNRGNVADPSIKLALRRLGFSNVLAVDEFDTIEAPGGSIMSVPFPGEHCELDIQSKHCVSISLRGVNLVFLVDSDAVDPVLYTRLSAILGRIDALFIGMECVGAPLSWLYGPLLLSPVSRAGDQSRRGNGSNSERALAVVEALQPKSVFVYAMGLEPWNRYLLGLENAEDSPQIIESSRFVAQCEAAGTPATRLKGCREMYF
jgi:L-ascorbate metabolism protein UlaG (beta-lactamase superfamily)